MPTGATELLRGESSSERVQEFDSSYRGIQSLQHTAVGSAIDTTQQLKDSKVEIADTHASKPEEVIVDTLRQGPDDKQDQVLKKRVTTSYSVRGEKYQGPEAFESDMLNFDFLRNSEVPVAKRDSSFLNMPSEPSHIQICAEGYQSRSKRKGRFRFCYFCFFKRRVENKKIVK